MTAQYPSSGPMTAQYPSPPDLDGEGDVEVGLGAALVDHLVPLGGHACTVMENILQQGTAELTQQT